MVLGSFIVGIVLSLILTPLVKRFSRIHGLVDKPDNERKLHLKNTPLLGGAAIFLALLVGILLTRGGLLDGLLLPKHLIGIMVGGIILIVGGALDDKYDLNPGFQLLFTSSAALAIIASGVGNSYITNPFGGTFRLDLLQIPILSIGGDPHFLTLPGDLFTFLWLMVMMYTTKLLDGIDGLVSGLGLIGFTVIALLSLTPEVAQPELARLAMLAAGAVGGFLFFNASPASIFLGEGGSTLVGFLLGTMAILSGGKIGITLMVLAVPIMDLIWTVFRRAVIERRSIANADLGHLHFRLVAFGLSANQTVLTFWLFAAAFGGAGLFIRGSQKVVALAILGALFVLLSILIRRVKTKHGGS